MRGYSIEPGGEGDNGRRPFKHSKGNILGNGYKHSILVTNPESTSKMKGE